MHYWFVIIITLLTFCLYLFTMLNSNRVYALELFANLHKYIIIFTTPGAFFGSFADHYHSEFILWAWSVQVLFHLFVLGQQSFQFNNCFHVHLVHFHQSVLVTLKHNSLILLLWVVRHLFTWDISFVLHFPDFFEFFCITGKLHKPSRRLRQSRRQGLFELKQLFLLLFLVHLLEVTLNIIILFLINVH